MRIDPLAGYSLTAGTKMICIDIPRVLRHSRAFSIGVFAVIIWRIECAAFVIS